MAASFLKSYANFGRVLWWLDDGKERAIAAYRSHLASTMNCELALSRCRAADSTGHRGHDWGQEMACLAKISLFKGDADPWCADWAAGDIPEPEPPYVLDARWDDASSQLFTAGLLEVTARRGVLQSNANVPLTNLSGWHNVSFALLYPDYKRTAALQVYQQMASGVTKRTDVNRSEVLNVQEAGQLKPGDVCHDGPSFKLMGIYSC